MSKITKAAKITDAIPLVVKKAKLVLLKSLCLTKVCWYIKSDEKHDETKCCCFTCLKYFNKFEINSVESELNEIETNSELINL